VMIAQGGGIVRHVRWNKRKRLVMKFREAAGATIGDISQGAFYFIAMRGVGLGAGDIYVRNMTIRMRFVDE